MKKLKLLNLLLILILTSCAKKEVIYITENGATEIDQYIVVLKQQEIVGQSKFDASAVKNTMDTIGSIVNSESKMVFTDTIKAGVFELSRDQVHLVRTFSDVKFIEKDDFISINEVQLDAPYNLDRLDQEDLPLDGEHTIVERDAEVNAYVIDTGLRVTHDEFESRSRHGFDFVDSDSDVSDCNGHGTHVAGTLAGKTYGAAKNVKVHGVRVLGCTGGGRFSDVIAGIEWVTKNHIKPAVANMSLGGGVSTSIDEAIEASIQTGVIYVVAAGNSNADACNFSPARVEDAITVGSTTKSDDRSSFSNHGDCVDIFAPGSDILSAWSNGDSSSRTISGTSMASPLVAGVVANYLSRNPDSTPSEVKAAILAGANEGKLSGLTAGSPDLLVSNLFLLSDEDEEEEEEEDDGGGGGEDKDGEDETLLADGDDVEDLSGESSEELHYRVNVGAGVSSLEIRILNGSGDADLYLKKGDVPTRFSYDCRPFKFGNTEVCEISDPSPGTYHIMIRAYSDYKGVELKVAVD